MKVFIILAALVGCALGQGPALDSYNEIRNRLLEGNELSLNVDTRGCQSNAEAPLDIAIPLRQWQVIDQPIGPEEIRSDDFYIDTQNPSQLTSLLRTVNIYSDDTVRVTLLSSEEGAEQLVIDCNLGQGSAVAHQIVPGSGLNGVQTYDGLKIALLLGDHVEAVGYVSGCEGAEVLDGVQYTLGYEILRFEVIGDGTDDQYIYFDDNAVLSADGSAFEIGVEAVVAFPNNTAVVTLVRFNTDFQELSRLNLVCELGTDIRFTVLNRQPQNSFTTYEEIRESTLTGHDVELVAFATFCEVLEGEALENGTIISARFDEFQLFKAGDLWGDMEYITYSQFGVTVEGSVYDEVATLYEDGSLTLKYEIVNAAGGGIVNAGLLSCPLGDASVFHAISRTRDPVNNFDQILRDIHTRGQLFEIEIDYDTCSPSNHTNTIGGGIAWQTYTDVGRNGDFFYADFSALTIGESDALTWDAHGVLVTSDNVVLVFTNEYDFVTGASVLPEAPDAITCELGNGVSFYRYP